MWIERDIASTIAAIEEYQPELKGILPQNEYLCLTRTDKTIPKQLLKNLSGNFNTWCIKKWV